MEQFIYLLNADLGLENEFSLSIWIRKELGKVFLTILFFILGTVVMTLGLAS